MDLLLSFCSKFFFCFVFSFFCFFFFFNDTATTEIYTLSLHDVFRSRGRSDPNRLLSLGPSAHGPGFSSARSGPERPAVRDRQWVLAREQPERDRDLAPAPDTELLPQHVTVGLRSSRRDSEPCADLVVRATRCDQSDHFPLARRNGRRLLLRAQLDHGSEATPPFEGRPFVAGCKRGC